MAKYILNAGTKWVSANSDIEIEMTDEEYQRYLDGTMTDEEIADLDMIASEAIGFGWCIHRVN